MPLSVETEHNPSAASRLAIARESLEATPARATKLLRGIGSSLVIRSILLQVGLTRADLEEGWSLLRDACGLSDGYEEEPSSADAADAIRTIDAWDEQGLMLVRATIAHRFPQQASFLLAGLSPHDGPEAVVGVATLLDRLDGLEHDPRREETRDDDHATLELLAKRGLTIEGPRRSTGTKKRSGRSQPARASGGVDDGTITSGPRLEPSKQK